MPETTLLLSAKAGCVSKISKLKKFQIIARVKNKLRMRKDFLQNLPWITCDFCIVKIALKNKIV